MRAYSAHGAPPPIKLDANESPWPLPEDARLHIAAAVAALDLHRYPDGRASALREAIAEREGGHPDEFVLGCGSDEVIAMLLTALSSGAVVFPSPSFVMYGMSSRVRELEVRAVPLADEFTLDLDATRDALGGAALAFYASPNNPTGNRFPDEALAELIDGAPETLHVIDEAYAGFADQRTGLFGRENVALMGTLSKVGFAGLRLGWLRAAPALAQELDKVRQPYNLNAMTIEAATVALNEFSPLIDEWVTKVKTERARLSSELSALGHRVFPSEANFLLVDTQGDAEKLAAELREIGIGVRVFANNPRLAGHLRITVGRPDENNALLDALRILRSGT